LNRRFSIEDKLAEKKKVRKLWQNNKCPTLKIKLNRAIKAVIKNLLELERNLERKYKNI